MPHIIGTEGDDTITISRYGELSLTPAPLITIDGGTLAPRLRP